MIRDPKQIVTPYAFEVDPELLGKPLATPKRRLLALFIDVILASFLTILGPFILAGGVTFIFIWLAHKAKGTVWWKNLIRYSVAAVSSIFVFALTFTLVGDSESADDSSVVTANDADWSKISSTLMDVDYTDEQDIEDKFDKLEQELEKAAGVSPTDSKTSELFHPKLLTAEVQTNLQQLQAALATQDSIAIDSLRLVIAPIIASIELDAQNARINSLNAERLDLKDRNKELADTIENPSFLRVIKAGAEDIGLKFGWIGIYFIICLPLFGGRTLGKKLLSLQVVRLNNKPITIWYSFERFGGYAAGFATGLLGFFQIFWDANRQAIHDKIAGTVVLDLRNKKAKKYEHLRQEILQQENLLSE
ncbi:RDD family protein [Balneola vulgaris]|uniref:RDD family protein n=1 Tax=Balneola vulgaris TaxID=287535 RepID=UPI00036DEC34|nr:RDD family protein [Balneola vulgaris]